MNNYREAILAHYITQWKVNPRGFQAKAGPVYQVSQEFETLEFPPSDTRDMWTYATSGMSSITSDSFIELHVFSARQCEALATLLTAVAHYHQTEQVLFVGHTVNFGIPWQESSPCTYGLISMPYLDGPGLEEMQYEHKEVDCYWLIPITKAERDFKKANGLEALEELFDENGLDYVNPYRKSVV